MIERIEKIQNNVYFAKKQPKFGGPLDSAVKAGAAQPNARLEQLPRDTYQRAVDDVAQVGMMTTSNAIQRSQRGDQIAGRQLNVVV